MNQLLFGSDRQRASHLERDVQCLDRFQRPFALHASLEGFPVDELHDIKIIFLIGAEIEDGGDVGVSESGGRAGFAQETLTRRVAFEIGGIDNLQRNGEAQVGVVSLVGNPHRSPTQLPKAAILPPEYFVLLIALGGRHCG